MGSKIRVLHIIPGFGGGISSHVRNIINGINKDEVTIDVAGFTPYPDEFIAEVNNKGGKTFTLDNVRIHNLGKCIKQFREIVISGNYDAIHMHLADVQAVYFSILASTCGIKRKIVHAHIADQQGSEKALFKIRKKINQILTVSSATDLASCSKLSSEFRFGKKYVDENRVMHIPNSINATNYFEKISEDEIAKYREEFKIKEEQLIIGHVGFFGYQKNHPFMFKIARRLKERGVDFVWLFIGTGYNFDEYVHLAEIMGLGDCVRFLGRRNDVCALYKIMNVSVLASFFEGLPTVTIETQAAGTATVISDSISDETDMGLNMIKRVSLNDDVDNWSDAILEMSKIKVPEAEERKRNIEKRAFTTLTAAKLYTKFLKKEIMTYNLGTEIE
ncbi:glycosyltransferase [Blautia luti]|uniref:glycosyltransferase n=1 Tax=Blautia luti TaxID=89014 RepID=UPI001D003932|nr:glycosyltransferase [Blautia luti]MCB5474998.1 glycosyltransferase [Blautia luti]